MGRGADAGTGLAGHNAQVRLFVGIAVAGLLAACTASGRTESPGASAATSSAPHTSAATAGVPLPVRVTEVKAVPVPAVEQVERWLGPPDPGASPLEQVLRDLRYRTLSQARMPAPTTARCAGDRLRTTPDATTRCTVTYQGLPVPWTVTVTDQGDNSGTVDIFGYTSTTDRFVVRADVIRAQVWQLMSPSSRDVRCTRIPALRILRAGPTGDRCQYLDDHRNWQTFTIAVSEDGNITAQPA
jgi:hypothetical protein